MTERDDNKEIEMSSAGLEHEAEEGKAPSVIGPGARLRQGREAANLSIRDVATYLHLRSEIIENIEADDYASIGSHVFIKGYLRAYASMLNDDAPAILLAFKRMNVPDRRDNAAARIRSTVNHQLSMQDSPVKLMTIIITAGLFALLAMWWHTHQNRLNPENPENKLHSAVPAPNHAPGVARTPSQPATPQAVSPGQTITPRVGGGYPAQNQPSNRPINQVPVNQQHGQGDAVRSPRQVYPAQQRPAYGSNPPVQYQQPTYGSNPPVQGNPQYQAPSVYPSQGNPGYAQPYHAPTTNSNGSASTHLSGATNNEPVRIKPKHRYRHPRPVRKKPKHRRVW